MRAQQLYSDCVYERQEQIREKEVMKLWEKEKEKGKSEQRRKLKKKRTKQEEKEGKLK